MLELSLIVLGLVFTGTSLVTSYHHGERNWWKAARWNRWSTWSGVLWTAAMFGYLLRPFLR